MKSISAVTDIYDRIAAVKSINRYEALGHLTRQRHILHFLQGAIKHFRRFNFCDYFVFIIPLQYQQIFIPSNLIKVRSKHFRFDFTSRSIRSVSNKHWFIFLEIVKNILKIIDWIASPQVKTEFLRQAQISHFWIIFLSVLSVDKIMISRDSMKLFDRKCARGN